MLAVEVRDLSFSYTGERGILKGISFDVRAGETFVIAGLSGSGKTTLLHILAGLIPNFISGDLGGEILLFGETSKNKKIYELSETIGLVFQDSDNQMVCTTVEDELAFGLENLCVEPSEIRERVDAQLERFRLTTRALENPGRLSGGWKKILAIASVLITRPRILLLDEPMTGLDPDSRALVTQALRELQDEGGTIVIVEHDLSLVTWADRWLLIENGQSALVGMPGEIMDQAGALREMGLLL